MPVVIEELQTTIPGAEHPMVVGCTILVEGEVIDTAIPVVKVEVEREVGKIPSATLTILDGAVSQQTFPVSNRDLFVPGRTIEIRLGYQSALETVFKGIIIGQGNRISGTSTELTVSCRDIAVRMTVSKRNAHYSDITDSDLAEQLISRYPGLSKEIESTSITHQNLAQYNQTDWDFMLYRFDLLGMFCTVEDGKITIAKPDLQKPKVFDVVFGSSLIDYQATIDARSQSGSVTASSWDYSSQEVNSGTGAEPALQEAGNIPAADLASAVAFEVDELKYTGKWEGEELKALADARLQKQRLSRIRGKVKFQGTPMIRPNEFITVGGIGDRYSGPLYVSGVQHIYEDGNWLSEARLGLDPAWFAEKINPYHPTAAQGIVPSIQGLHIGIVTDQVDAAGEFRVRVRIPAISEAEEGLWARQATLDAGPNRGTFFLPEVGDEVLVGFIGDDPRQAVILGMLYSSTNQAALQPESANNEKGYVSRSSFKMIFNDEKKSLTIQSPAGKKIVINDQDGSIFIEDENSNKWTMDSSGITVESASSLILKGGSEVKIEAPAVSINGSGKTDIKGGMVNIN